MKKNYLALLFPLILMSDPVMAEANKGMCVTSSGTPFHSVLPFYGKKISTVQNKKGQTFNFPTSTSDSYPGHCECSLGKSARFYYIYYTAIMNEALTPTAVRSGVHYYQLNDYLDVGIAIEVLGRGKINAPFEMEQNIHQGTYYDCGRVQPLDFTSGDSATIYFYIREPFIGTVTIPPTLMSRLYATISNDTPIDYARPLADVYISGDITAPQECEINGGQTIVVDFNKIPASEFSSVPGTAITSRKIPVKVAVKCTGMSTGQNIDMSLHAMQSGSLPKVISTDNPNVGIIMYDEYGTATDVNGGLMDIDMGRIVSGRETGEFNFSAAPASTTSTRPQLGIFTAEATIIVEIKN